MNLSIIIVNYNTADLLCQCLTSIYSSPCRYNFEVIVIDNASSDLSCKMVKKEFPQVKLVENERNTGFAKANNQGLRISQGEYILFLNPDTVILKNALEKLLEFMETHTEAGAVGAKLLYPDGTVQLSCRRFYTPLAILMRRTFLGKMFPNSISLKDHLMSDWDHNEIREVDWMLAACLIVPRHVLDKVGCFDEQYTMYFEDVDICYRIKKAGYKVYYYPEAMVTHYHQRESAQRFSKKTIWHIQSAIRFFNKFGWRS